MRKLIIMGIMVATLSGCATKTIPLTASVGSAYRGKSITYAVHETPDFSAMTADKAMFGGLGGVAMVSKGNKIIKENEVPDPAITIGATLSQELATKYGLMVKSPSKRTASKKVADLSSDYNDVDLVLDVRTFNWSFSYLPMDWDNYRILYVSKLKLIDTKKQTVLASGTFKYDSSDSGIHPSYGQLMNNKAEGLKKELKRAEAKCIADFKERIL